MTSDKNTPQEPERRAFLKNVLRGAAVVSLTGVSGIGLSKGSGSDTLWQIDPHKCTQCGKCATACVLKPSAVKCVHSYAVCGYCQLCLGYYRNDATELDTAAENQICPTAAIKRTFIEDPYYEYTIDEKLCIGCGKCVAGCENFGNGSLFLQIRHDLCVNCNECAIARACPSQAIKRVPRDKPYILKDVPPAK